MLEAASLAAPAEYPTVAELGTRATRRERYGLAVPARTPVETIAAIRGATLKALNMAAINKGLTDQGYVTIGDDPGGLRRPHQVGGRQAQAHSARDARGISHRSRARNLPSSVHSEHYTAQVISLLAACNIDYYSRWEHAQGKGTRPSRIWVGARSPS